MKIALFCARHGEPSLLRGVSWARWFVLRPAQLFPRLM